MEGVICLFVASHHPGGQRRDVRGRRGQVLGHDGTVSREKYTRRVYGFFTQHRVYERRERAAAVVAVHAVPSAAPDSAIPGRSPEDAPLCPPRSAAPCPYESSTSADWFRRSSSSRFRWPW